MNLVRQSFFCFLEFRDALIEAGQVEMAVNQQLQAFAECFRLPRIHADKETIICL